MTNREQLRAIMAEHNLNAPDVARILSEHGDPVKPQTVNSWAALTNPAHHHEIKLTQLRLLRLELLKLKWEGKL